MKKIIIASVLFVGTITSRGAFADNWTPGTPKPATSYPDMWVNDLTRFFSDIWNCLMY